ncbi:MAG: phytoene/squalene synthase family protein [Gemmataceae bacterium]
MNLAQSYSACRNIVRRANSSFPLAFRLLSRSKRRSMNALYAFARLTDDIADEPGEPSAKRAALEAWSNSLKLALSGIYSHPIHWALHDTVQRFGIPREHLFELIAGVEMDLEPIRFANFDELRLYCRRVAGVVGLACIRIWGLKPHVTFEQAEKPAEAAGLAFQLTNILRDLGEDDARGRCYLPESEFGTARLLPSRDVAGDDQTARQELRAPADELCSSLEFQIERARDAYRQAAVLDDLLTNEGRAIFCVMCGTYRSLLELIAADPIAVFEKRVRVSKWRKAAIFLSAWPVKWGLR